MEEMWASGGREEVKQGKDFGKIILKLPPLYAAGWLPQSLATVRRGWQYPDGQLIGIEASLPA